jgi:Zn-dependent protease with chaperone function/Zn-finger nucleic acid-binding protein
MDQRTVKRNLARDFYEIQEQQARKSRGILAVLVLFYFLAVCLIAFTAWLSTGLILARSPLFSGAFWTKFLLSCFLAALLLAILHYFDALKFGASFILKRLCAQEPDRSDRYHLQFINVAEEMQIASGLPKVKPLILPTFAINSLALIESDKTPCVVVTEGLLADFTRDELEAVVAHELAHIARGDTLYMTLVCSLANFFERIREALEPGDADSGEFAATRGDTRRPSSLVYVAVAMSTIVMRLLSMLISRERELLADAAAVEFSRNPVALARAIYKAHVKNSFVGDFNQTYSPLFIVAPDAHSESEDFLSRLISTHPPLMTRLRNLAQMAGLTPPAVIDQVRDIQKEREKAKIVLHAFKETHQGTAPPAPDPAILSALAQDKIWLILSPQQQWRGPYSLQDLLFLPNFTPLVLIKNIQEGVEARARQFPQIRTALEKLARKKPVNEAVSNKCPRCKIPLTDAFYEGVPVKICGRCSGKLVDQAAMERILDRQEVGFSEALAKKAQEFKERFFLNPIKTQKISAKEQPNLYCPNCGYKMTPRPYNYQYFIPVDKCLSCFKVWYDADELEILQVLVEKAKAD